MKAHLDVYVPQLCLQFCLMYIQQLARRPKWIARFNTADAETQLQEITITEDTFAGANVRALLPLFEDTNYTRRFLSHKSTPNPNLTGISTKWPQRSTKLVVKHWLVPLPMFVFNYSDFRSSCK
jgi:hypothetical protein